MNDPPAKNPTGIPFLDWIDARLPIFSLMQKEYGAYPTPRNFNYLWNFGAIAMALMFVMIGSGVILAMHYTADTELAFNSVERIMRDVNYGWLIRYIHMNGASMFFFAVYVHIFRGLYYGSYKKPRELLWILGVKILFLMIATAFMGYVLPWGQMSFWAATVITNLVSAVPFVGEPLVNWIWGGFSVGNPTLTRFFALHYLLPFVILALVFLHVAALHVCGFNNPLGIDAKSPKDTVPFHPYYTVKDLFALCVFLLPCAVLVFWMPNALGHPDNYVPANPMVTPAHIVPEWYFLPFYAILRSFTVDIVVPFSQVVLVSSKLGGVILLLASIGVLFALPWLDRSPVRSARYRPIYRVLFWIHLLACLGLGWLGAQPAEGIHVLASQILTAWYFLHFLVFLPLLPKIEKCPPLPPGIHEYLLSKKREA